MCGWVGVMTDETAQEIESRLGFLELTTAVHGSRLNVHGDRLTNLERDTVQMNNRMNDWEEALSTMRTDLDSARGVALGADKKAVKATDDAARAWAAADASAASAGASCRSASTAAASALQSADAASAAGKRASAADASAAASAAASSAASTRAQLSAQAAGASARAATSAARAPTAALQRFGSRLTAVETTASAARDLCASAKLP